MDVQYARPEKIDGEWCLPVGSDMNTLDNILERTTMFSGEPIFMPRHSASHNKNRGLLRKFVAGDSRADDRNAKTIVDEMQDDIFTLTDDLITMIRNDQKLKQADELGVEVKVTYGKIAVREERRIGSRHVGHLYFPNVEITSYLGKASMTLIPDYSRMELTEGKVGYGGVIKLHSDGNGLTKNLRLRLAQEVRQTPSKVEVVKAVVDHAGKNGYNWTFEDSFYKTETKPAKK